MDLSNCKLIESCDYSISRKKVSIFPIASTNLPELRTKTKIKLPYVRRKGSPSPTKFSSPKFPNHINHNSLAQMKNTSVDLKISCKRYKIAAISPSELISQSKGRIFSHKFITAKANDHANTYFLSPKSKSPAHKLFFSKKDRLKHSDNLSELISYQQFK